MDRKNILKLLLDLATFVAFLVAMDPRGSGLPVHEWLSLALAATLVLHLLLNWTWIAGLTRRFLRRVSGMARLNYALNWLLFIDGTLLMLSGILISEIALPALGVALPHGFAWRSLHNLTADLGLVLLGLHTAFHWTWIVNAFKRLFAPRRTRPQLLEQPVAAARDGQI